MRWIRGDVERGGISITKNFVPHPTLEERASARLPLHGARKSRG
jgi:hypothetical protein